MSLNLINILTRALCLFLGFLVISGDFGDIDDSIGKITLTVYNNL